MNSFNKTEVAFLLLQAVLPGDFFISQNKLFNK